LLLSSSLTDSLSARRASFHLPLPPSLPHFHFSSPQLSAISTCSVRPRPHFPAKTPIIIEKARGCWGELQVGPPSTEYTLYSLRSTPYLQYLPTKSPLCTPYSVPTYLPTPYLRYLQATPYKTGLVLRTPYSVSVLVRKAPAHLSFTVLY
jgi:hypothetical protein